ncbi:MAG TPA: cyanophycin synthetase, partial [Saprospiraceae bacterium]|nr:cyanophycin synthetase [Saprospiraceae bacterium]
ESNGHQSSLVWDHQQFPLHIFGKHNLQNIQAVLETCSIFGLNMKEVFESLTRFKGASKRMELVSDNGRQKVYRDFAHAPSKVKATLQAIRDRYPSKSIGVILELHTYSSLNPDFLPQYKDSCQPVDQLVVYFDQKALEIKRMAPLDADLIQSAFNRRDAIICPDLIQLQDAVSGLRNRNDVLLFLGSGQFGGLELAVAAD